MQWAFLGKVLPQSNISSNEQFPAPADSSPPEDEATPGRGQRSCSVWPAATLAPQPPGCAPCQDNTLWVSHTAPDLAAAPVYQSLEVKCCPPLCCKPPANLCCWPPPCTGGEGSHYLPLGTACGRVSQRCNTFISVPLISNLSLSTLCSPSPSITLDRETAANKEGICSCLLKDNSSLSFSFSCECCQ